MKKVAVVILIFVVVTIAPQGEDIYIWFRDNTPGIIEKAGDTFTAVAGGIAETGNSVYNTVSNWMGGVIPAAAPAATQPASSEPTATPSPTPTPAATPAPAPSPSPSPTATPRADLFGAITGQTYVNETAGLQLDFPEGYTAYGMQAIRENIVKNSPLLQDAYGDAERFNGLVQSGVIPVFSASKHSTGYSEGYNSNMAVNMQQMTSEFPGNIMDIADYVKLTMSKTAGYTKVQDPQSIKLNGTKAALITATVNVQDYKVTQKIYLVQNNGWLISITASSAKKAELNEMAKAVQTAKITAGSELKDMGDITGQTYSNRTGGFTLSFPEGYTATNEREAINKYSMQVFEAYKAIYRDPDAVRESLEEEGSTLNFVAYKHPKGYKTGFTDEISVDMFKMDGYSGSAMDYAALEAEAIPLFSDKITVDSLAEASICGLDGAELQCSYKIGSYTIKDKIYIFEKNGYIVAVYLSALDDEGMKELDEAFGTLRILTGA